MKRLYGVFGSRRERRAESRVRRRPAASAGVGLRAEPLEPRALLAVTVPPNIVSDVVEIDDNVLVDAGAATIEATAGYVQIFGNSRGRIDAVDRAAAAALTLQATSAITVTGAIGSITPFDGLTLTTQASQPVSLQQAVTVDDDLLVARAGSVTFGGTVTVGDDLTITQAANVLFSGNVTVGGDLTITSAAAVTFSGTLTVGGALRIIDATGAVRFLGDVSVAGADVTSRDRVIAQAGFGSTGAGGTTGDVSFTTDQVGFNAAIISTSAATSGAAAATLTIKPRTPSLPMMIASPPGVPTGLLITDAAISAIQGGWKRVVLGDEAAGTGAVTVGSIGSQYGFSQLLNTTTIVGGSITVVQPVDVTSQAAYLDLVARSATIAVKAPINQTAAERNDWVRLTAAGAILLEAPVSATQTVSLSSTASSVIQNDGFAAAITAPSLAVTSDGAVHLADSGNAFDTVAIETTDDDVVLREDSGYSIGEVETTDSSRPSKQTTTVTGIRAGSGTVRLVTVDALPTPVAVTQTKAIRAGGLGLEGADTDWTLSRADNNVGTVAAAGATGSVTYRDADGLTIGTVAAAASRTAIAGIAVSRTADITAGKTLTLDATGDIVAGAASGTTVRLAGAAGIVASADVTTSGGDALFNDATRLAAPVAITLSGSATSGTAVFLSTVDGTSAGQQSLAVTGNLDARASVGGTTALESLAVSGDSALADGITLRTVGDQAYSGKATSAGTITVQAGEKAAVKFLGDTTLEGLVTATAGYAVVMTGSTVAITNAVTFGNTGAVTLGDQSTDDLWFKAGIASIVPSTTSLAGTIRTSDAAATFGQKTPANHAITLVADTTVSTGTGKATFSGTVDGPHRLDVNASGDTTFSSAVGGGAGTALTHLETDAPGTTFLDGGAVTTASPASQVYNDDVLLGADTTLDAGAGAVTFAKTLNGFHTLAVNTTGITTFGGTVGAGTPLESLTTDAGGSTNIDGGAVTTAGLAGQIYYDDVRLGADTTLTATGGLVAFAESVTGADHDLSVVGAAVLGDAATDGVTGIDDLVIDGPTVLNGNTVSTAGTQTFKGPVTATQATAVTLSGKGLDFKQSIDCGEPGNSPPLTITAGTAGVAFGGDAGTQGRPFGITQVSSAGDVSLAGTLWSAGRVSVISTQGAISGGATNAIRTPFDTVRLDAATGIGLPAAPIGIEAASVSAATATGGIFLRAAGEPGNLWIGADGLKAPGAVGLDARNAIGVYAGGRIQSAVGVTATLPISWSVTTTDDTGAGSLRQVLLNINEVGDANAAGLDARLVFEFVYIASPRPTTVFMLATPLPEIRAAVEIVDYRVTLDGGARTSSGLVFGAAASGSTLRGVTLRNFTGYGVQLIAARDVTIDRVTVLGLNRLTSMGVYATGDLSGTKITGSTFSGGLRGGLLVNARNLRIGSGEAGMGNAFANNKSVPGNPTFAGTGIRAQGDCGGTVVQGNTFSGNNYGFAFMAARGVTLRSNSFARNSIAGIYVEGICTGSAQSGSVFATAKPDRNKANLVRARGAKGV